MQKAKKDISGCRDVREASKNDHGGNVGEIARIYGIDEKDIIDFSASINPLGYPPGLREAVMGDFDSVLNYPDINSFDLVSALSEYHGIEQDCILAGNGSTEFMYLIPLVFRPENVLIVAPAFSEYGKGLALCGARISYFPADEKTDFSVDTDLLCKRMGEGFDAVYFCNPANPTGVLTSKEKMCGVIKCAEKAGVYIIVDEAFIDFTEEESVKSEIFRFANLMVLRSLTKFFGIPGLRLGYVISYHPCIDRIRESRFPWTVNTLVQGAAVATLFNEDYIERTRRYISVEREFLKNALNGIYGLCAFESSANFIFVSIDEKTGMNSRRLRDKLAPEGILIRDCGNFEGLDNRYFRVAVKEHAQNVVLIEKLKKVFGEI